MYDINNQRTNFPEQSIPNYSLIMIDDDRCFRQGLITFLTNDHQQKWSLSLAAEAENYSQAIELVNHYQPDLILLDLCLGENKQDGIQTLATLKQNHCRGKILVLSAQRKPQFIFEVMQLGACGYVVKDCLNPQLLEAITTIVQGKIYLPPEIATSFFDVFHSNYPVPPESTDEFAFTERETEVLNLLVEGKSNQKIANQLFITVATVKAHLTSIFSKLSVKNRSQAIVKALKFNLVTSVGK